MTPNDLADREIFRFTGQPENKSYDELVAGVKVGKDVWLPRNSGPAGDMGEPGAIDLNFWSQGLRERNNALIA